ncbi:selenocysteine-specific translation elongation factor [Plesiomonas sp.]|uniref:selenocysteine-specific translation elongation factor n=1 Tax=Plesiomonas sp. TaxID=2486279 RepID=UPI003F399E5F
MLIATAGHVDHGKTTLLHAITGINADRLPEEKQRGMTIDLGYAYWPQPDGRVIGFIDVPGHEKFLANMLAGIGGIDHALLLVACDDGIMPQTREHLQLLHLSGLQSLSVVLTKADRVNAARQQQVRLAVTELLSEYGWQHAPCFITAATQQQGLDALKQHLQQLKPSVKTYSHRFRLAIDRVFTVKGAGTVVTGTALSGQVAVGDTLWLTGKTGQVSVRSLHAQNQAVSQAQAGQRVALNLRGADPHNITRGDWLLAQAPVGDASDRVIVSLDQQHTFTHWQPLHLYHAASHITGRISLLTDHHSTFPLAELRLDTPLYLAEKDRLILRDISARYTLGQATVIDLTPPKRGKRHTSNLAFWQHCAQEIAFDQRIVKARLQQGSINLPQFSWARQLTPQTLNTLLEQNSLISAGNSIISTDYAQDLMQQLCRVLADFHQQNPDQQGISRSRLQRMTYPLLDSALFQSLIKILQQQDQVTVTQGWLHLPEHRIELSQEQQQQWQYIHPILHSAGVSWVRDLATQLQTAIQQNAVTEQNLELENSQYCQGKGDIQWEENRLRQLLQHTAKAGLTTAIVPDRYCLHEQLFQYAALIRTLHATQGSVCAADFRDHIHIGRKLAIQILEYFDRSGFTRRRGNSHIIRDHSMFTETDMNSSSAH